MSQLEHEAISDARIAELEYQLREDSAALQNGVALAEQLAAEKGAALVRIDELLANGNRLLDEARAARRELASARFEAEHWRRVALTLEESLRRLRP